MKKILLGLVAVVVVAGGVAALSAYEAHIINVTAHIENALTVPTEPIPFGTVFPQEDLDRAFTMSLSTSFKAESDAIAVDYVIVQKPKPIWTQTAACIASAGVTFKDIDEARAYCIAHPTILDCCYRSLCPFLSKENTEIDEDEGGYENDSNEPSYYVPGTPPTCNMSQPQAIGRLDKRNAGGMDDSDVWVIDLKVPPVAGYVGQDWPAGCPTVAENDKDYGCDLWIEVTDIERVGG